MFVCAQTESIADRSLVISMRFSDNVDIAGLNDANAVCLFYYDYILIIVCMASRRYFVSAHNFITGVDP